MKTKQQIIDEAVKGFEEKFGTDIYKHTPGYWNGNVAEPSHDEHISVEVINWLIKSLLTAMDAAIEAVRLERRNSEEEISNDDWGQNWNEAVTQQSKQIEKFTNENQTTNH